MKRLEIEPKAKKIFEQINKIRHTFVIENKIFPDAIKINIYYYEILEYCYPYLFNLDKDNNITFTGLEVERTKEDIIHIYKKGC